jgi:hypothetical protein
MSSDGEKTGAARDPDDGDAWISSSGEYTGPPPRTIVRLHRGLILAALFFGPILGLLGAAALLRGGSSDVSVMLVIAAVILFMAAAAVGSTRSCPRCRSWWTRKVVRRLAAHVSNRSERIFYDAELVCQRCGLRWTSRI